MSLIGKIVRFAQEDGAHAGQKAPAPRQASEGALPHDGQKDARWWSEREDQEDTMKALTLTQPHAQLIAIAARYPDLGKKIETRSWATRYRGLLAIHAAKGLGPVGGKEGFRGICFSEPFLSALTSAKPNAGGMFYHEDYFFGLPFGAIVAVVRLFDIEKTEDISRIGWWRYQYPATDDAIQWHMTEQELAFGNYSPGRFAWLLTDIRALPEPVPAKGALGLWELDTLTKMAVMRQLIAGVGA